LVEELHEIADQVRILTLIKHITYIPCQPIFKAIESRHNCVNKICKQLFSIDLEKFLENFFGKIFFAVVFIRNLSFTVVVNGRYRIVGSVTMLSSLSGSERTDVKNFQPKY